MDNSEIIKYIEKNIDLIDANQWEEFFKNAPKGVGEILYEAGIPFMEELGYVPHYTFFSCSNLTRIDIPNSVTSIGYLAFYRCTSLTSITIPDSIISIDGYAFHNCSSLTNVIIPDSVMSIGSYAFRDCRALKNIQFKGTLKEWNSIDIGINVFSDCPAEYVSCIDGKALIE